MFAVRPDLFQVYSGSDNFHVVQGELAALSKNLSVRDNKGAAVI